jgi:molybdenum cofactor cytidylyltransferase
MGRTFAIVPAAGHSLRMGQPKLLMRLEGRPLIEHSLEAWRTGGVDRIVVVVRAGDAALAAAIGALPWPNIDLVRPRIDPPDMKASVQAALRHVAERCSPANDDAFLVAPADMPRLSPEIIGRLIVEGIHRPGKIVVPTIGGHPGHPVLFPWELSAEVHALSAGEGLNALVDRGPSDLVACDLLVATSSQPFADIDTPDEYRRLAGE